MKIITISKIGYNAPSQANWNYGVWKLDLIDTDNIYNMSYVLYENFGGDSRLKKIVKEKYNVDIIETKGVYTGTGTQKITGLSKCLEMESKEVNKIISEFLNEK